MTDFKYGDLICYKASFGSFAGSAVHDQPLMYVGPCGHREGHNSRRQSYGLIDILSVGAEDLPIINHKDPAMWQRCRHFAKTLDDLP